MECGTAFCYFGYWTAQNNTMFFFLSNHLYYGAFDVLQRFMLSSLRPQLQHIQQWARKFFDRKRNSRWDHQSSKRSERHVSVFYFTTVFILFGSANALFNRENSLFDSAIGWCRRFPMCMALLFHKIRICSFVCFSSAL